MSYFSQLDNTLREQGIITPALRQARRQDMALELFVNIRGSLHEIDPEQNWPTTAARCPIDGTRLIYTVHGECFYCENEEDEHVFGTTLRAVAR